MEKSDAINKIKLLLKLADSLSGNSNESDTARLQAEKLKKKFDIQDSDLSDGPDPFDSKFFLYSETEDIEYKRVLAITVSNKFFCSVVQQVTVKGPESFLFEYSLFGEDSDVEAARNYFNELLIKVDNLVRLNCTIYDTFYQRSFAIGVVDSIKERLEDIELSVQKQPIRKIEEIKKDQLAPKVETLVKPIKEPTQVSNHSEARGQLINPYAYLLGKDRGESIQLILSLEEENDEE